MHIFVIKDLGDPWNWFPAGGGQDHSAEEWDGEEKQKKTNNFTLYKFV